MMAMEVNLGRYNRNIIIERIGFSGQQKLLASKVLVAGCGGLGSTVISNLASAGIGTIGIIDNDQVELTNLNRQYIHKYENIGKYKADSAQKWINQYNPDIKVNKYQISLDESNAKDIISLYDIVVDCFDSYNSGFFLTECAYKTEKFWFMAELQNFLGRL